MSMWPNPQFPEDSVTFTEEILNGKFYFLCSVDTNSKNGVVKENQEDLPSSTTSEQPLLLWRSTKNHNDLVDSATKNKHN